MLLFRVVLSTHTVHDNMMTYMITLSYSMYLWYTTCSICIALNLVYIYIYNSIKTQERDSNKQNKKSQAFSVPTSQILKSWQCCSSIHGQFPSPNRPTLPTAPTLCGKGSASHLGGCTSWEKPSPWKSQKL